MKDKIKLKANELIIHYYLIVYPYIGSSFMTGDEIPEQKFALAKKESIYLIQNIIDAIPINCKDYKDFIILLDYIEKLNNISEDWELLSKNK